MIRLKTAVTAAGLMLVASSCTSAVETTSDLNAGSGSAATPVEAPDSVAESQWPTRRLRLAIGSSAGGGIDVSVRQVQPGMAAALGVDIIIENHSAGSGAVAGTLAAVDEACETILGWAIPHLISSYTIQNTNYDYSDFYPLGRIVVDTGVVVVPSDSRWSTLQELIDEAIARPGEVTVSVGSFQNAYYQGLLQLQELTGAEFNIVPFGGGSEARNAVVGGQVDFTYAAVFNRLPVRDHTTVLGVAGPENLWPDLTDNAPTMSKALGLDVPAVEPSYGLFASKNCYENHPDRFEKLSDALASAMVSADFLATLEQLGETDRYSYQSAADYHASIMAAEPGIVEFLNEFG